MAKILIIDDDLDYAECLRDLYTSKGHEVHIFPESEGAIKAVQQHAPDLLILDIMFPESAAAGFDLAREIRAKTEFTQLPIILFSSINTEFPLNFSSEDIEPDWMPVQEFIEKSSPLEYILETSEKLLASR